MTTVIAAPHATMTASPTTRPAGNAILGAGSERSRSKNPWSLSSATPTAMPHPAISMLVATMPGIRKST